MDIEILDDLWDKVMVERNGFAFFVDIEYKNLPYNYSYCKCIGHYYEICKRRPFDNTHGQVHKKDVDRNKTKQRKRKTYVYVGDDNKENKERTSMDRDNT